MPDTKEKARPQRRGCVFYDEAASRGRALEVVG